MDRPNPFLAGLGSDLAKAPIVGVFLAGCAMIAVSAIGVTIRIFEKDPFWAIVFAVGLVVTAFAGSVAFLQRDRIRSAITKADEQREEDRDVLLSILAVRDTAAHLIENYERALGDGVLYPSWLKSRAECELNSTGLASSISPLPIDIRGLIRRPKRTPARPLPSDQDGGKSETLYSIEIMRRGADEAAKEFASQRKLSVSWRRAWEW